LGIVEKSFLQALTEMSATQIINEIK
jgi:hypothetical protein